MTANAQQKYEKVIVQDINHPSDKEQAEKISDHFSDIPTQYENLKKEDINIPDFQKEDIPQFKIVQVWDKLTQLKTNKSPVKGYIPSRIFKEFAVYIAFPLAHVYNSCLQQGEYLAVYKF